MKRIFQLFRYRLSLYKTNVWYNLNVHSREGFPVVFGADGKYIPCEEGRTVVMGKTTDGKNIYYKVFRSWQERPWADWLYDSDSIHCDMIFSHVE